MKQEVLQGHTNCTLTNFIQKYVIISSVTETVQSISHFSRT